MLSVAVKEAGCERMYRDVASGAKAARLGFGEALDYVRSGDTFLSRGASHHRAKIDCAQRDHLYAKLRTQETI